MKFRLLLLVPLMIGSLQGASVDDLIFTLNDGGTAYEVYGCNTGATGEMIIPSTYNSLPVTEIGDYTFQDCRSLTSITIPDSVTEIGNHTFEGCRSLTSITIPDSVTEIGNYTFQGCRSLTSITIPDSVTSIGIWAFSNCTSLTSITIPDSVTSIGIWAFRDCSSLTSITIPDSVTSIGNYTFRDCSSLTSITIPDSVTSIGSGAFENTGLSFLEDTNSIKYLISASGNKAYLIDGSSASGNVVLPSNFLGASVTLVAGQAFYNCTSLTSITIPDSVTSIGQGAFNNCSSLTSITIPDTVTSIGIWAFYNCTSLTSITIPDRFAPQYANLGLTGNLLNNLFYQAIAEVLQEDDDFIAKLAEAMIAAENNSGLATKEDLPIAVQQGINQVVATPSSYNLATNAEVAQARSEGVTAGIQAVTSDPQSYQLYSESSILEMNVSNPTLSMLNESEEAQVEFTLETSTDLEDWAIEERIQRTVQATGDKFFVRISSGAPYVTPTVVVFNHPSYGEILTDQDGNVLYGFSIDSAGGDPLYSGSSWPLASHSTDPEPDADVSAALTRGTFSNTSGGPWLKINDRPVYTYVGDSEPNQASGHGQGSVWFTIRPDGTLNQ